MKYTTKKILQINCTLDSSETLMFTKNGMHSTKVDLNDDFDEIEITFQMDPAQALRYIHVTQHEKKQ